MGLDGKQRQSLPRSPVRVLLRGCCAGIGLLLFVLAVGAAPASPAPLIACNGTGAADTINLDETVDGPDPDLIPGICEVNAAIIGEFDGTVGNAFTVNSFGAGGGVDKITVTDNRGNDSYTVGGAAGTQDITINDGGDNDKYLYQTGRGRDIVTINDSVNPLFPQTYIGDTGAEDDTVTINDSVDKDKYSLKMQNNNDSLKVTDDDATADGWDLHGNAGPMDSISITDIGGPPQEDGLCCAGLGHDTFEIVAGTFI